MATINYQLSQFKAADHPSWLNHYTPDMLKIDTALNSIDINANAATRRANDAWDKADAALPKTGGTVTGNVHMTSGAKLYVNNTDVLGVANAALPKTGGTVTGNVHMASGAKLYVNNTDVLGTVNSALATANNAYPRSGGALTGSISMASGTQLHMGYSGSLYCPRNQHMVLAPSRDEANYKMEFEAWGGNWWFRPSADHTLELGHPNAKFRNVYATTGTINTSDRTMKKNITQLDDDLVVQFVEGLQACSYQFIKNESGRTHYGFISQDVEALMDRLGMSSLDFAGFIKSPKQKIVTKNVEIETGEVDTAGNPIMQTIQENEMVPVPDEYIYGLRYEEFIPLVWRYAQIVGARNIAQEQRLANLETRLDNIENR